MQFLTVSPSPAPSSTLPSDDGTGNFLDQLFGWIPEGILALGLGIAACFLYSFSAGGCLVTGVNGPIGF